jgi:hypothetical protein
MSAFGGKGTSALKCPPNDQKRARLDSTTSFAPIAPIGTTLLQLKKLADDLRTGDAEYLYSMIWYCKPNKITEVSCGHFT